jgi:hypothetical protein
MYSESDRPSYIYQDAELVFRHLDKVKDHTLSSAEAGTGGTQVGVIEGVSETPAEAGEDGVKAEVALKPSSAIPPTVRALIKEAEALYSTDPKMQAQEYRTKLYADRIELAILIFGRPVLRGGLRGVLRREKCAARPPHHRQTDCTPSPRAFGQWTSASVSARRSAKRLVTPVRSSESPK